MSRHASELELMTAAEDVVAAAGQLKLVVHRAALARHPDVALLAGLAVGTMEVARAALLGVARLVERQSPRAGCSP